MTISRLWLWCVRYVAGPALAITPLLAQNAEPDRGKAYYHYSMGHLYAELAGAYGNRGEYLNQAIDNYRDAMKADPEASFIAERLSDLYLQAGRVKEAITDSEAVLRDNPNDLNARRILGRIYLRLIGDSQQGRVNEQMVTKAIEQYAKISEKQPTDLDAWLNLGRLYKVAQNSVDSAGLQEVARFYTELRRMGVDVTYVDVGGGLGVDYDGTNSTAEASVNYTPQEYANDVVYTLAEACREHELPMPNIISESGRALTAHHAMLLLKVIDVETNTVPMLPSLTDDDHTLLHEMLEDWVIVHSGATLKPRKVREIAHDASFDKERARQYFSADALDLRSLAIAEQLHLGIMNGLQRLVRDDTEEFEDILEEVEAALTDRYFCNFSLFQSLPDHWAIDQLFPVMPVHRLDERPDRMGTLQDVTCDSDGKIDRFVGDRTGRPSLELHVPKDDDDYVLGIFLTGAYQEILGDLHNLFGDTNAVHVKLADDGRYVVSDIVHGDTVTEVLNYVQFHAPTLLATFRRKVQNASGITRGEANTFIADYVAGLEGYTYLEGEAAR